MNDNNYHDVGFKGGEEDINRPTTGKKYKYERIKENPSSQTTAFLKTMGVDNGRVNSIQDKKQVKGVTFNETKEDIVSSNNTNGVGERVALNKVDDGDVKNEEIKKRVYKKIRENKETYMETRWYTKTVYDEKDRKKGTSSIHGINDGRSEANRIINEEVEIGSPIDKRTAEEKGISVKGSKSGGRNSKTSYSQKSSGNEKENGSKKSIGSRTIKKSPLHSQSGDKSEGGLDYEAIIRKYNTIYTQV